MTTIDPKTERPQKLRLEIDLHNLEKECANQPKQSEYFARALADARLEYDNTKSELKVLSAQIDKEAREDPASFDIGKVTETTVYNAVLLDPRHQAKDKQLNEAAHKVAILEAAISGLVDRKKSLSGIIGLFEMEYFSISSDEGVSMPAGVRGRRSKADEDD